MMIKIIHRHSTGILLKLLLLLCFSVWCNFLWFILIFQYFSLKFVKLLILYLKLFELTLFIIVIIFWIILFFTINTSMAGLLILLLLIECLCVIWFILIVKSKVIIHWSFNRRSHPKTFLFSVIMIVLLLFFIPNKTYFVVILIIIYPNIILIFNNLLLKRYKLSFPYIKILCKTTIIYCWDVTNILNGILFYFRTGEVSICISNFRTTEYFCLNLFEFW